MKDLCEHGPGEYLNTRLGRKAGRTNPMILIRAVEPDHQRTGVRQGAAARVGRAVTIALGGIGGGEAATVLPVAGDDDQPVALRRAVMEVLELCQVPAERNAEITGVLENPRGAWSCRAPHGARSCGMRGVSLSLGRVRARWCRCSPSPPSPGRTARRWRFARSCLRRLSCGGCPPEGEPMEMVVVPGGEPWIGSPEEEAGRQEGCRWTLASRNLDKEPLRKLRLAPVRMARLPITQAR